LRVKATQPRTLQGLRAKLHHCLNSVTHESSGYDYSHIAEHGTAREVENALDAICLENVELALMLAAVDATIRQAA
jgi:hypothetical protein